MVSIVETSEHAAKSYFSTLAVLQLDSILVGAKKVSVRKTKMDNKNQKPFERIIIMEHELVGIGTVKMTVGVRRSTHEKVQYCITAIDNKEWKKASFDAFDFAPECVWEVYARKSVMLCWRGLRTTHIHRPHTTCFQLQKYNFFWICNIIV